MRHLLFCGFVGLSLLISGAQAVAQPVPHAPITIGNTAKDLAATSPAPKDAPKDDAAGTSAKTDTPATLATVPGSIPGAVPPASGEYVLASGDHIHLTVYGEDDLSGDYVVSDTGYVALPLVGKIMAAKTTAHDLEVAIASKLSTGYLHDPKVSIQLLNYRPFFILGEVAKPGSYPYVDGMNVLNAVALAGGYTYRASTSRIKIIHTNDPDKKEKDAEETESVQPGDIVKVPERYF